MEEEQEYILEQQFSNEFSMKLRKLGKDRVRADGRHRYLPKY